MESTDDTELATQLAARELARVADARSAKVIRSWGFNHSTRELYLSTLAPGRVHFAADDVHAIVPWDLQDRLAAAIEEQSGERTKIRELRDIANERAATIESLQARNHELVSRNYELANNFATAEESRRELIDERDKLRGIIDRQRAVMIDAGLKITFAADGKECITIPPWSERPGLRVVTDPDGKQSLAMPERHVCHDEEGTAVTEIRERLAAVQAEAESFREAFLQLLDATPVMVRGGLESVTGVIERIAMNAADRIERGATAALEYTRGRLLAADDRIARLEADLKTDQATMDRLAADRDKAIASWQEARQLADHRQAEIIREAGLVADRDATIAKLRDDYNALTSEAHASAALTREMLQEAEDKVTVLVEERDDARKERDRYLATLAIWQPVIDHARSYVDRPERQAYPYSADGKRKRDSIDQGLIQVICDAVAAERPESAPTEEA